MVDVAAVAPQEKWKVRKISAKRDFPPGCGRCAAFINQHPITSPLDALKQEENTEHDAPTQLVCLEETTSKAPKPELTELVESLEQKSEGGIMKPFANGLGFFATTDLKAQKEETGVAGKIEGSLQLVLKTEDAELQKENADLPVFGLELNIPDGDAEVHAVPLSMEPPKADGAVDMTVIQSIVPVEPQNPVEITPPSETNIPQILAGQPGSLINVPTVEKRVYSKTHPPPKRRKVSAVRDFPVGCGMSSTLLNGQVPAENLVALVASVEKHDQSVERQHAFREMQDQSVEKQQTAIGKMQATESLLAITSCKILMDDTTGKSEEISEVGREKLVDRSNSEKGKTEASVPLLKSSWNGDESNQTGKYSVESNEDVEDQTKKNRVVKHYGKVFCKSYSDNMKEETVTGSSGTFEEKIYEIRSEAHARSAPMIHSCGNFAEDHDERKVLVKFTSKKKLSMNEAREGSTIPLAEKDQEIKLSCLNGIIQPGSKLVDKEVNVPRGSFKKGPVRNSKDTANVERNLLAQSEDKIDGVVVPVQVDESLEDYGGKLVVQSLMAAQKCPWSLGRRSVSTDSLSVTPKNKVKRERTAVQKYLSEDTSSSLPKDKVDIADMKIAVGQNEDNDKVRRVYKGLLQMNINVTPFGPSTSNVKAGDGDEKVTRNKVKRALRLFQVICRKLLQEEEANKNLGRIQRIDLAVAGILKENKEWLNVGKPIVGPVPGVEVGDEFHYRVELAIIGLHRPFQGGIDWTNVDGELLATSIVASGGYSDEVDNDVLIYTGQGGKAVKGKQAADQKLERGNLALKNNIDARKPVRVIRGYKETLCSDTPDARSKNQMTFTYDGLYLVEEWKMVTEENSAFKVFKFYLRRMPGQPQLAFKEIKQSKKLRIREGQIIADISGGKEKKPICVVNTIDDERPAQFQYITKNIYPSWYVHTPPVGCDCSKGCSDSEKCACALKNGGEIPYNYDGAIVQAKPLVYECGPSCKCNLSCHNRVSQRGIRIQLEVFKTKSRGWGVRSLNSIPSGTFVCEYVGEILKETEAEQRSNDEYLFDIGHNYDDHSLWEGLPSCIPGLQSSSLHETGDDSGFTIDAAQYGNIGRFINHSCSPNLYAQNVLFDHDDKRVPHIMFFAADNIPPLQELTYHYNYTIDQVRDSEGNIKQKNCYCGSHECTGRLY